MMYNVCRTFIILFCKERRHHIYNTSIVSQRNTNQQNDLHALYLANFSSRWCLLSGIIRIFIIFSCKRSCGFILWLLIIIDISLRNQSVSICYDFWPYIGVGPYHHMVHFQWKFHGHSISCTFFHATVFYMLDEYVRSPT